MDSINISVSYPKLLNAINKLPMKTKYKLIDKLEKDLLSKFDEYDNSQEVREKIELSMSEYRNGEYKSLTEINIL